MFQLPCHSSLAIPFYNNNPGSVTEVGIPGQLPALTIRQHCDSKTACQGIAMMICYHVQQKAGYVAIFKSGIDLKFSDLWTLYIGLLECILPCHVAGFKTSRRNFVRTYTRSYCLSQHFETITF
jgi:hypothetical protein